MTQCPLHPPRTILMPKTTTTARKVDIVDLIRKRKQFTLLDIPAIRVVVDIEVTTTGLLSAPAVPSSKMDRLAKAAQTKLEEYEDIISSECERFSKKIQGLIDAGKQAEADKMASEVNASVKNALASAEVAAKQAVEATKKKESQGDKLLTEARVKTTVKITFQGISIVSHGAAIVASHGTHVAGYISIAKSLASLAAEIQQQLKNEAALRKDFIDGMNAYLNVRSTAVQQAIQRYGITNTSSLPGFPAVFGELANRAVLTGSEMIKGKEKSQVAREIAEFAVAKIGQQFKDVETARQKYREHTTKTRQKVDALSVPADKLVAAMKSARDLKEGVKIGAEAMQAKARVRAMADKLEERQTFLDQMQSMMQDFGLKIDDRTVLQKIRDLDKMTILSEANDLRSKVGAIYDLVSNVAAVA